MLSIRVDAYEFDSSSSEESLEIDVARASTYPYTDIGSFIGLFATGKAAALPCSTPFDELESKAVVREYLARFARLDVPLICDWPVYFLDESSWDQLHMMIESPQHFVRYFWSTSA